MSDEVEYIAQEKYDSMHENDKQQITDNEENKPVLTILR